MWQKGILFLAGVVIGPVLKPILRPLAREIVKGGLIAGAYIHRVAAEAREDLDDLAAEAKTELDAKARARTDSTPAN